MIKKNNVVGLGHLKVYKSGIPHYCSRNFFSEKWSYIARIHADLVRSTVVVHCRYMQLPILLPNWVS